MKENYIKGLKLKNFTAFDEIEFEFSPGINVLIGANSTGKTHTLKVLYSSIWGEQKKFDSEDDRPTYRLIAYKLQPVFLPLKGDISRLISKGSKNDCEVEINLSGYANSISFRIKKDAQNQPPEKSINEKMVPRRKKIFRKKTVFIPTKEILTNAPGFISEIEKRYLEF